MAKTDPKGIVTNKKLDGAVDAIMKGLDKVIEEMQGLFIKERKYNTETFATKEDLKREAGWLKDDIKGLKADLSDTVSRKDFNHLKNKLDRFVAS